MTHSNTHMISSKLKQSQSPVVHDVQSDRQFSSFNLYGEHIMHLAKYLELSDRHVSGIVNSFEADPVFKRLSAPEYPEEKIISRRPFPYTRLASDFFHFVELPVDQTDSFSVVKNVIQQAGMERFMHFYLSDETHLSPEQIAANCLSSIDDVIATFNFLNQAYVPSGKIGEIICEQYVTVRGEENERLVIAFYSPLYARGLYEINYRFLPFAIKKIACEENHIRRLIRAIELVNLRMNIMYKLIQNILFMQKKFCKSGGLNDRIRLTQLDMAQHMQLDKSIICRTIRGRSLVIQGSEIPLKDFFPGRKKILIELLGQILRSERRPMTDEALRKKLFAQSRITISRRSVSAYRKKLEIVSSFKRKKINISKKEKVKSKKHV